MRALDRFVDPSLGLPLRRTAGIRWDLLRSSLLAGVIFLAAVGGETGEAQAKGKSKTWSPPIPPGRAAITLSIRAINALNAKVPARVMWGRRLLGETPLNLPWPADSGPVDIVVAAPGYVSVHTRLYTFASDKVLVKMVDDEGKKALFGYKREAPSAPAVASPSGAAAPAGATPAPGGSSPPPATPAPSAAPPVPSAAAPPATPTGGAPSAGAK